MKQPHAVLLALVDLEKAFNRVSHQLVIEDLAAMHVPGWLLLILISYLTERSMYIRYKGETSKRKLLPGFSQQGAFLGILLFIILLMIQFKGPVLLTSMRGQGTFSLWKTITCKSSLITWKVSLQRNF